LDTPAWRRKEPETELIPRFPQRTVVGLDQIPVLPVDASEITQLLEGGPIRTIVAKDMAIGIGDFSQKPSQL